MRLSTAPFAEWPLTFADRRNPSPRPSPPFGGEGDAAYPLAPRSGERVGVRGARSSSHSYAKYQNTAGRITPPAGGVRQSRLNRYFFRPKSASNDTRASTRMS